MGGGDRRKGHERLRAGDIDRKVNRESTSKSGSAFDIDSSAMSFGNGTGDTESQADTPDVFGPGLGNPMKSTEDLLHFRLG